MSQPPQQPINVNVQTTDYNGIPTRPLELVGWIISWAIWAYCWMLAAAVTIYFVESKYDLFATIEELLHLIFAPALALVSFVYTKILYPLFVLATRCIYDCEGLFYSDTETHWYRPFKALFLTVFTKPGKQPPYVPPKYAGGDKSQGCKDGPGDPPRFTQDYMFCNHKRGKEGGCQYCT